MSLLFPRFKRRPIVRPPEGSIYTHNTDDPEHAYNGYTGIVEWSEDEDVIHLEGETSWLCNINLRKY